MEYLILDKMNAITNGLIKQTKLFYGLSIAITEFRLGTELQLPRSSYNGDSPALYQQKCAAAAIKRQRLVEDYKHLNEEFNELRREGLITLDYANRYNLCSARNLMDMNLYFHGLVHDAAYYRNACENFLTYRHPASQENTQVAIIRTRTINEERY